MYDFWKTYFHISIQYKILENLEIYVINACIHVLLIIKF